MMTPTTCMREAIRHLRDGDHRTAYILYGKYLQYHLRAKLPLDPTLVDQWDAAECKYGLLSTSPADA